MIAASIVYLIANISAVVLGAISSFFILRKRGIDKMTAALSQLLVVITLVLLGLSIKIEEAGVMHIGFDSLRGVAAVVVALFIDSKIFPKEKRDIFAATIMSMPLMYAIGKIGCTFAGCCRGFSYGGVLALSYSGEKYFPIQPLETLVFLCIYIAGLVVRAKNERAALNVVVVASLLMKFGLEFLRLSNGFSLSAKQRLLVFLAIIWITLMLLMKRRTIRNE